jgi:hypothetical protein
MSQDRHLFRVVYVVARDGELGPLRIEEFHELLAQQKIMPEDHVRSAFGVRLGTVGEVMSGRVKVGSDAVLSAHGQRAEQPEFDDASAGDPAASRRSLLITIGVVAALLLGGILVLRPASLDPVQQQPAPSAVTPEAQLGLTLTGEETPSGAIVQVGIRTRTSQPAVIRFTLAGDAALVRTEPADGVLTIPPGAASASLIVRRLGDPSRERALRLEAQGPGGELATLALRLAAVPLPSLAWDPLAPAGADLPDDRGWADDDWSPARRLRGVEQAIAVPGAATPPYHSFLQAGNPQWLSVSRPLTTTVGDGVVWLSCVFQIVPRADGTVPWVGVALKRDDAEAFWVGAYRGQHDPSNNLMLIAKQDRRENDITNIGAHARDSARVVLRLDLSAPTGSAQCWVDPPPGAQPPPHSLLRLATFPRFSFNRVELGTLDGSGLRIAELRLGRSWTEVFPGE